MTLQQIFEALSSEFEVVGRIAGWIGIALVLYLGRRVLAAIERIPPAEWFATVGRDLKTLASDHVVLEAHSGAIVRLEDSVADIDGRLTRIQGQHELLHGPAARIEAKGC